MFESVATIPNVILWLTNDSFSSSTISRMKIRLLYEHVDTPMGGLNTFFRNFHEFASKDSRVELVNDGEVPDVVLTSGSMRSPSDILKNHQILNVACGRSLQSPIGWLTKNRSARVVFRVDGLKQIYAGTSNVKAADDRLINNIKNADAVVCQSEYSRRCFVDKGVSLPKNTKVIFNGANTFGHIADPTLLSDSQTLRLVSSSWSMNDNKGFSTIAEFSCSQQVEVNHVGRWPKNTDPKHVKLLGERHYREIPSILKNCHYLLFPSRNEACPNTVVEALSAGVPVMYHPSGGTIELCADDSYGIKLPEESLQNENLEHFISQARDNYTDLAKRLAKYSSKFGFRDCYDKYIGFLGLCCDSVSPNSK